MRLAPLAAMTVFALGGCVQPDAGDLGQASDSVATEVSATEDMVEDVPFTGSKSCNDDVFAVLAGKPLSVLDTIDTPDKMRVLAPGSISTSDYIPQRLNVEHDDKNVITRAYCG